MKQTDLSEGALRAFQHLEEMYQGVTAPGTPIGQIVLQRRPAETIRAFAITNKSGSWAVETAEFQERDLEELVRSARLSPPEWNMNDGNEGFIRVVALEGTD